MNSFDAGAIHFINRFSQRSWVVDRLADTITHNTFVKGAIPVCLLWWGWFRESEKRVRDREIIVASAFTCTAALIVARALALLLPFRERPFFNPTLHFRMPLYANLGDLIDWSSFPSDHALFYFAIATCVFLLSHKAGILTYFYVLIFVCIPRLYMGIHYPTDIVAGAVLGIAIGCLPLIGGLRRFLARRPLEWFEHSPATFYACFYLVTFLFGTAFDPLREILTAVWHGLRGVMHNP